VAAILSPRADSALTLLPKSAPTEVIDRVARADGLTLNEAAEMAAWLRSGGYESVDVIHQGDKASVVWNV
jgi:hypothetical protein